MIKDMELVLRTHVDLVCDPRRSHVCFRVLRYVSRILVERSVLRKIDHVHITDHYERLDLAEPVDIRR